MSHAPAERRFRANGLLHHVLEWNPGGEQTVLLCHGFLDLAWSFEAVAKRLADQGYRVLALDFRGHGESERVGAGGYYHFPDYVLDLDGLLPQLAEAPLHLVGHSMGGTACALYAGTCPERTRSLALLEGLGPPAMTAADTADRLRAFVTTVTQCRERAPSPLRSIEDALRRMRVMNPDLDDTLGLALAERATRPLPDGSREWRFDPLHRTTAPTPFVREAFLAILRRISAPTLAVMGERGYRLADERERLEAIADHEFLELPNVGHMLHWFAAEPLALALGRFFARH